MRTTGLDVRNSGMSPLFVAMATLLLTVTANAGNVITVAGTSAGEHLGSVGYAVNPSVPT